MRRIGEFLSDLFKKRNLNALQLALEGKDKVIQQLKDKNEALSSQYTRLQKQASEAETKALDSAKIALFQGTAAELAQLVYLQHVLAQGGQIELKDIALILEGVPRSFFGQGLRQYAQIGDTIPYDPKLHTPVNSARGKINAGEDVVCALPGFEYKGEVVLRAEVKLSVKNA